MSLLFFSSGIQAQEINDLPIGIRVLGELRHIQNPKEPLLIAGTDSRVEAIPVTKNSRIFFYGKKPNSKPPKFLISIIDAENSSSFLEVNLEQMSLMTGIHPENLSSVKEASTLDVSEMERLNKIEVAQTVKIDKAAPKKDLECDVALTFDDGPHTTNTPRLLNFLKAKNVPSSFFLLAERATESPKIMKQMLETRGADEKPLFFMANHSHDHPNFFNIKDEKALNKQITSLESNPFYKAALKQQNGKKFFRCPYGNHNQKIVSALVNAGYPSGHVDWDIDPEDWKIRNAQTVSSTVINRVRQLCKDPVAREKGIVVLLHDIHKTSVDATEIIVNQLQGEVNFVTIDKINPQNTSFKGLKKDPMHGAQ